MDSLLMILQVLNTAKIPMMSKKYDSQYLALDDPVDEWVTLF